MFVTVDLAAHPPAIKLEEPSDCNRFHVEVSGGRDGVALGKALVEGGVGRVDGEDAFIEVIAVRSMAEDRVGPGWLDDFNAMLTFAKTRGWLAEQDSEIRAHIEWR